MKSLKFFSIILLILFGYSFSSILRHNEQGLTSSHTYKQLGANEVVSNSNGNLSMVEVAAEIARPDLSLRVTRSFNSMWRNPLGVHMYDMDFDHSLDSTYRMDMACMIQRTKGESAVASTSSNAPILVTVDAETARRMAIRRCFESSPDIRGLNVDPSSDWYGVKNHAGFVRLKRYSEHTMGTFAPNWYTAALMAYNYGSKVSNMVNRVSNAARNVSENSTGGTISASSAWVGMGMTALSYGVRLSNSGGGINEVVTDPYFLSMVGKTSAEVIASSVINSLVLDKAAQDAAKKVAAKEIAIAYAIVNYAIYLCQWDDRAPNAEMYLAAETIGLGLTIVAAASGNAYLMAAAAVYDIAMIGVQLYDQYTNDFDLGDFGLIPWGMGINGYQGIVGTKFGEEQSRHSKLFGDEDGDELGKGRSFHPMAELWLINESGGADHYVINTYATMVRDGIKYYAYTPMSAKNRVLVYFADRGMYQESRIWKMDSVREANKDLLLPEPGKYAEIVDNARKQYLNEDTADYYLVKLPNGTYGKFGLGKNKGVVTVRTPGYRDPYEFFWALPTSYHNYAGDSLSIVRDSSYNVENVNLYVQNEVRNVAISRTGSTSAIRKESFKTLNGNTLMSQRDFEFKIHDFKDGKLGAIMKMESNGMTFVPQLDSVWMLTKSVHKDIASQNDLVTTYEYTDGNLHKVNYPNGSTAIYQFDPANSPSIRNGSLHKKTHYSGAIGNKPYQTWEYTYVGLGDKTNTLKTRIRTTLVDQNGVMDPKEDEYKYSLLKDTQYVYSGQKNKPRSYVTFRMNPLMEVLGVDGVGQITTTVYDHDRKIYQTEKTGKERKRIGLITSYMYDSLGNMIVESKNPRTAVDVATRALYNSALNLEEGMSGAEAGPVPVDSLLSVFGADVNSIGNEYADQTKLHFYFNDIGNEFYRDSVYASDLGDSIHLSVRDTNVNFNPFGRYIVGKNTGEGFVRKNETDTAGNFTVLRITMLDSLYLRPQKDIIFFGDSSIFISKQYFYGSTFNKFLATRTHTFLDLDSNQGFVMDSIVPDPTFHMLPASETRCRNILYPGQGFGNCNGLTKQHEYDFRGLETTTIGFAGETTTMSYDGHGRLVSTRYPDNSTDAMTYVDKLPSGGASQTGRDRHGVSTKAVFDGLGRLNRVTTIGKTGQDSLVDQYKFNVFNKVSYAWLSDGAVNSYWYDKLGRVTRMRTKKDTNTIGPGDPEWMETLIDYIDTKATVEVTDPMGHKTVTRYDVLGNAIEERRITGDPIGMTSAPGDSIVTRTNYDNQGNVTSIIDPRGLRSSVDYSWMLKPVQSRYPDGQVFRSDWNLLGQEMYRVAEGPGGSDSSVFAYDGLSRVLSQTWVGGNAAWSRSYKYDSTRAGTLSRVQRGTHSSTAFGYDTYGYLSQRKVSALGESGLLSQNTANFSYYTGGSRMGLYLPGSGTPNFFYGYDEFNRFDSLAWSNGSVPVVLLSKALYAGLNRRTGYRLGDDIDIKIDYEASRPLVLGMKANHISGTKSLISEESFVWDRKGNLYNYNHYDGEKSSYGYDNIDRLVKVDYPSGNPKNSRVANYLYQYDKNGNPTLFQHDYGTLTMSYPDTNNQVDTTRQSARDVAVFAYDYRGNRSAEVHWVDSATMRMAGADTLWTSKRNYSWSPENELVQFKELRRRCGAGTDRPMCGGVTMLDSSEYRYHYDDANRKILTEKKSGTSWVPQREYYWDSLQVVYEKDMLTGERTYFGMDGINRIAEVHVADNGSRKVYYRLNDHLGHLTQLLDSTGNRVGRWRFEPYGRLEAYAGSTTSRYTWGAGGKEWVEELGMYDFGARFYDPHTSSWTAEDPARQYVSPYLYAGNNPVNRMDPDGEFDQKGDDDFQQAVLARNAAGVEMAKNIDKTVKPVVQGAAFVTTAVSIPLPVVAPVATGLNLVSAAYDVSDQYDYYQANKGSDKLPIQGGKLALSISSLFLPKVVQMSDKAAGTSMDVLLQSIGLINDKMTESEVK